MANICIEMKFLSCPGSNSTKKQFIFKRNSGGILNQGKNTYFLWHVCIKYIYLYASAGWVQVGYSEVVITLWKWLNSTYVHHTDKHPIQSSSFLFLLFLFLKQIAQSWRWWLSTWTPVFKYIITFSAIFQIIPSKRETVTRFPPLLFNKNYPLVIILKVELRSAWFGAVWTAPRFTQRYPVPTVSSTPFEAGMNAVMQKLYF